MTLACPVGHPSSDGARTCPLCGRKYVKAEQVVLPPSKDEVLAQWRADRRAQKAAVATAEAAAIPAARASAEALADDVLPDVPDDDPRTFIPESVTPRLIGALSGALFVSAFVLGESAMLSLSRF